MPEPAPLRRDGDAMVVDARGVQPLAGAVAAPPDKSISHRALLFAAMCAGRTEIIGLSTSEDVGATRRLIGEECCEVEGDRLVVTGGGGLSSRTIDCGNSGTTARLGMGYLAAESGEWRLRGDASLLRRPMDRVAAPLRRLGADVTTTAGFLPALVHGTGEVEGSDEVIEVASAQVHAALLMAGLRSHRGVTLRRTAAMRDHSLRIARSFGCDVVSEEDLDIVRPGLPSRNRSISIPGDPSGAAFIVTAAVLLPGASIVIEGLSLNPTRLGYFRLLRSLGCEVTWEVEREELGEPVGRLHARFGPPQLPVELDGENGIEPIGGMIDELPLVALVATQAPGRSRIAGASELRLKESDRISATARLLHTFGLTVEERSDGFEIVGGEKIRGGGIADPSGDHRLAMLAGVASLAADGVTRIDGADCVGVSWPGFWESLSNLTRRD